MYSALVGTSASAIAILAVTVLPLRLTMLTVAIANVLAGAVYKTVSAFADKFCAPNFHDIF